MDTTSMNDYIYNVDKTENTDTQAEGPTTAFFNMGAAPEKVDVSENACETPVCEEVKTSEAESEATEVSEEKEEAKEEASCEAACSAEETSECSECTEVADSTAKVSVDFTECLQAISALSEKVDKLSQGVEAVKADNADTLKNYKTSLDNLRISLAANQRNEDKIYKELEAARKDEYFTNIRPFLEFIVERHIDLTKSLKDYEKDKEAVVADYTEKGYNEIVDLHTFQIETYENELQKYGVTTFSCSEDSDYDAATQMPGKVVLTKEKSLVGKVAQCDMPGYMYNDKVLRKAKVRLYKEEV